MTSFSVKSLDASTWTDFARLVVRHNGVWGGCCILAEVAYVLESFYEAPRAQVATTLRAGLAFPAIRVMDADLLQRAVEVYAVHRLDFGDAYLVASAERTGVGVIASFDRTIDRVTTVRREEPS